MKVLIDADACPVVDIAVRLCVKFQIPCVLLCDTAHAIHRDGAETLVFDKGADSVDFAIVTSPTMTLSITTLCDTTHTAKRRPSGSKVLLRAMSLRLLQ